MEANCWTYAREIRRTQLFECRGGNRVILDGNLNCLSGTIVRDLQSTHAPDFAHRLSQTNEKTNGTITVKVWFEDPFAISVRISSVVRGEGVVVGGVDSHREGESFL